MEPHLVARHLERVEQDKHMIRTIQCWMRTTANNLEQSERDAMICDMLKLLCKYHDHDRDVLGVRE